MSSRTASVDTQILVLVARKWNSGSGGWLVSSHQKDIIAMPTRFGATDHPVCPKCKNPVLWRKRHKKNEVGDAISGGCPMPRY
jgi:hypothetical protein